MIKTRVLHLQVLALRSSGGAAFFGQALNFLAMLAPVFLSNPGQLAALVVVSGLAIITSQVSILAFPSIYPSIIGQSKAKIALFTSLATLLLTTGLMYVLGLIVPFYIPELSATGELVRWGAFMSLCQGAYFMVVGMIVRAGDYNVYGNVRLTYGVANVALTVPAALLLESEYALAGVASLVFVIGVVAGLIGLAKSNRLGSQLLFGRWTLARGVAYLRSSATATLSNLVQLTAFGLSALLIPFMGDAAHFWAIVVRVGGGFGALFNQVIAPALEMRLAKAVRTGNVDSIHSINVNGLKIGIVGAAATVPITLAAAWYTASPPPAPVLLVVGGIFVASLIVPSAVSRNLVLQGYPGTLLLSVMGKSILIGVCMLVSSPAFWPAMFAVAEAVFAFVYLFALMVLTPKPQSGLAV